MVKNEELFVRLSEVKNEPSELGRKQFFDHQSKGISPDNPDPYYETLSNGKWQLDYLSSEYLKMWRNREWWGWYQLWLDWEGSRWVLPNLVKWYPEETGRDIPDWITLEITPEEMDNHLLMKGLSKYS